MWRTFWRERIGHRFNWRRRLWSEIICTRQMNHDWSCSCCFSSSKKRIKWLILNETKNNCNKFMMCFDRKPFKIFSIVQSKNPWSYWKDTQFKRHRRINDVWEMIFTRNSENRFDVYSTRHNMQFMFTNERVRIMHQLTNCNDGRIVTGFRFENYDMQLQKDERKQIHSWIVRLNKLNRKLTKYFQKKLISSF